MQLQQDRESESLHAKLEIEDRLQGGLLLRKGRLVRPWAGAHESNPRVTLDSRRRQASTPRAPGRKTRWEGHAKARARSVSNQAMELEDLLSRRARKDKQRKESSRSPRGRLAEGH